MRIEFPKVSASSLEQVADTLLPVLRTAARATFNVNLIGNSLTGQPVLDLEIKRQLLGRAYDDLIAGMPSGNPFAAALKEIRDKDVAAVK